jgi:MFS family permease
MLYLAQVGLSEQTIGILLTLTLIGDAIISLALTTSADRFGRRRFLVVGAALMTLAGLVFAFTRNPLLLIITAIVGVISPSGNEIGPFLLIEQAALSQLLRDERRTHVFAWYNLVGSFATALGALSSGFLAQTLQTAGWTTIESYRAVLMGYAVSGMVLVGMFMCLSAAVEVRPGTDQLPAKRIFGLHRSRRIVVQLSTLFALDAFGGGLVVQTIMAYWFYVKFGVDAAVLGSIFFGANVLAGISALLAARIAARIGLINTMVYTHIPSNVLLGLIPLIPSLPLAIGVLLLRFSISQMDVPTRQSYVMAVVSPDERSAASGVTTIARSVGASISPALSGLMIANPLLLNVPFFLSGALKIIYDVLLYHSFKSLKAPEENVDVYNIHRSL